MKILLADPHTLVREGLAKLLVKTFPFAKIHQVGSAGELLKQVQRRNWDIVITEICMAPGHSDLETVKAIKQIAPTLKVLVLSICDTGQFAVRSIKAGSSGYLSKDTCFSELILAVNKILSGGKYISSEVADMLAESISFDHHTRVEKLSDREFEVLGLLGKGCTVAEIANQIILSHHTVSTFRSRIFEKMGFKNNLELIRYAVDHRLSE